MKAVRYVICAVLLAAVSFAWGQSIEEMEALGQESTTPENTPSEPAIRGQARGDLLESGVLLVPESSNDRVMAFDPETGDLIDADFIPADETNLGTPIQAHLNAAEDMFLVSDQIEDGVFAYGLDGTPLGLFAPAGGVDNSIADNVRGFAIDPDNGNILLSVASGANADAIAEFDTSGAHVGNRVANGAGGLVSPFDVLMRSGDILVPGITSDAVHSYDFAGTANPDFATVDTFPEQMAETPTGNILVANFSGTEEGVLEFQSDGTFVDLYNPASVGGNRGVYELGNGNILTTNGSGVHEIDRTGALVETKISGVSARFITFVQTGGPVEIPESAPVPALNPLGLSILILLLAIGSFWILQRRRRA